MLVSPWSVLSRTETYPVLWRKTRGEKSPLCAPSLEFSLDVSRRSWLAVTFKPKFNFVSVSNIWESDWSVLWSLPTLSTCFNQKQYLTAKLILFMLPESLDILSILTILSFYHRSQDRHGPQPSQGSFMIVKPWCFVIVISTGSQILTFQYSCKLPQLWDILYRFYHFNPFYV